MVEIPLGNPWTQIDRPEIPLTPLEKRMGHPTASGPRDAKEARHGGPSPGNGQPGVSRIKPGPSGTRGFPGGSAGGWPVNPDLDYQGPHDF